MDGKHTHLERVRERERERQREREMKNIKINSLTGVQKGFHRIIGKGLQPDEKREIILT